MESPIRRGKMIHRISISTRDRVEFQDVTGRVAEIVRSSGVQSGICHVFVPHTTAAVTINEHADPDVVEDIAAKLDALVPRHDKYRHTEGNSPAHIKASLIGSSEAVFIEDGRLVLGTWQGIFFCEFDGPRQRSLMVKVAGDR
jgi:secondary thiamine-phosphate synthase enzyme